jgi:hypothetical protein
LRQSGIQQGQTRDLHGIENTHFYEIIIFFRDVVPKAAFPGKYLATLVSTTEGSVPNSRQFGARTLPMPDVRYRYLGSKLRYTAASQDTSFTKLCSD